MYNNEKLKMSDVARIVTRKMAKTEMVFVIRHSIRAMNSIRAGIDAIIIT